MADTQADQIRKYINEMYFIFAREKKLKEIKVTAENVHKGLKLENRYPNVCSSMSNSKIENYYNVKIKKTINTIGTKFEVIYEIK